MIQHPKQYENVFSSDHPGSTVPLKIEKISVGEMSLNDYRGLWQSLLNNTYLKLYDDLLRFSWLRRLFCYGNQKTCFPVQGSSRVLNIAFLKYMRRHIGKDIQLITRSKFFSKLELYFDELYPGFMDGNPFENPEYYKYPFKFITMDYMMVVWQLDERVELLKYADEHEMGWATFADYVINHVSCENDRLGREKYVKERIWDRHFSFTIKDIDKDLMVNKKRKKHGN